MKVKVIVDIGNSAHNGKIFEVKEGEDPTDIIFHFTNDDNQQVYLSKHAGDDWEIVTEDVVKEDTSPSLMDELSILSKKYHTLKTENEDLRDEQKHLIEDHEKLKVFKSEKLNELKVENGDLRHEIATLRIKLEAKETFTITGTEPDSFQKLKYGIEAVKELMQ